MIELHWVVDKQCDCSSDCLIEFSIQLLNLALQIYLTEVSNWQAVTQNSGVGFLSDISRISDFFWKLGGGIIIGHGTILGSLRYYYYFYYYYFYYYYYYYYYNYYYYYYYPARIAGQGIILQQFLLSSSSSFFFLLSSICQHVNISETLCPIMLILGHNNKSVNAHFWHDQLGVKGHVGVTGVKSPFSPKMLFLLQIKWYDDGTHIYIHQLDTLYKSYGSKNSPGVIWGHRGEKFIFTKKCNNSYTINSMNIKSVHVHKLETFYLFVGSQVNLGSYGVVVGQIIILIQPL